MKRQNHAPQHEGEDDPHYGKEQPHTQTDTPPTHQKTHTHFEEQKQRAQYAPQDEGEDDAHDGKDAHRHGAEEEEAGAVALEAGVPHQVATVGRLWLRVGLGGGFI